MADDLNSVGMEEVETHTDAATTTESATPEPVQKIDFAEVLDAISAATAASAARFDALEKLFVENSGTVSDEVTVEAIENTKELLNDDGVTDNEAILNADAMDLSL